MTDPNKPDPTRPNPTQPDPTRPNPTPPQGVCQLLLGEIQSATALIKQAEAAK